MKPRRKTKAQLVKELEALRKINATIGTLLDLNAVLQRIIDEIVPLFAAQAASVILFDSGAQEAEITTAYGSQTLQGKPFRYPWQGSLAGWVAEHQRPLRLSRPITHEWQTSAKLAEQLGGSLDNVSVLLAPLWLNGEVLGCLEVVWDPQRDIGSGDEQLLETIATQVAIAIANARLYQEKEHALRAAQENEERYRDLVDNSEGLICTHDLDGVLLAVNPAAARKLEYQPHELIGRNLAELVAPSVRHFFPAYLAQVQQETSIRGSFRVLTKSGEERVLAFHNIRRNDPGRESYVVGHAQDITERVQAEEALRESEERTRSIIEAALDAVISIDEVGRIIGWNLQAERTFDWPREEVMGYPLVDTIIPVQYQDAHRHGLQRFVQTGAGDILNKRIEVPALHRNGNEFPVELTVLPVRWRGSWTFTAFVRDISERKRTEMALRESEERYRIVSQSISDYAFSLRIEVDDTPFVEWLTESFTKVTGYPISDFLGKSNPWARYIDPQDLERVNTTVRQMQPGVPTTYEFRIIRKDGETRWMRSYAYAVRGEKGSVTRLYGATQDITERKHAEDMLRYQRAFEQLIANISKDFLNLAPEEIDQGVLRALYMVGEFSRVDRSYVFLFHEDLATMDNTHEWCAPGIEPGQSRFRNIPTSTFPWFMKRLTDFEVIYIPEVSTLPPEAQAEKAEFQSQGIQSLISIPLVSGKAVIGLLEFATVRTTKRWTEESLLLLKVVGEIIVNALERKWAASRQHKLQAQLLQTQKLEAIGTLAGGIAHDFNNILAAIMGYTELATDDVPQESLTRRNLESVLAASRRARGLVQQLLTFSRPSPLDRRPIQLHKIVQNTLTLLRASFPKHIDIHFALPQPLDTIFADPNQIEQVVMNLCVNAAYAIGEHHGVLGIGIDYVVRERTTDLERPGLSIPAAYCLTISDTGCGIAPETLAHIFEPFFTTKPVGQGSGMGLAIVHSIVTSHGGSIAVESHPEQGTTFRVYFPLWGETAVAREAAPLSVDQELTA